VTRLLKQMFHEASLCPARYSRAVERTMTQRTVVMGSTSWRVRGPWYDRVRHFCAPTAPKVFGYHEE